MSWVRGRDITLGPAVFRRADRNSRDILLNAVQKAKDGRIVGEHTVVT